MMSENTSRNEKNVASALGGRLNSVPPEETWMAEMLTAQHDVTVPIWSKTGDWQIHSFGTDVLPGCASSWLKCTFLK